MIFICSPGCEILEYNIMQILIVIRPILYEPLGASLIIIKRVGKQKEDRQIGWNLKVLISSMYCNFECCM